MTRLALLSLVVAACAAGGCENTLLDRALIFSTHTTFGIEVSVDPASSSGPGKLIIGYQRTEGVINPVYYNHRAADAATQNPHYSNNVDDYYRDQAYSVIAKFEGEATGGGGGNAEAGMMLSQWFATGEAAEILAGRGGAAALTDNPGVAAAIANSLSLGAIERPDSLGLRAIMNTAYSELTKAAIDPEIPAQMRAEANAIMAALNGTPLLGEIPPLPAQFAWSQRNNTLLAQTASAPPRTEFEKVVDYLDSMNASTEALASARKVLDAGNPVTDSTNLISATGTIPAADKALIAAREMDYRRQYLNFKKRVFEDRAVRRLLGIVAGVHIKE